MAAPVQVSVKEDLIKLLEGEKTKLLQIPPSGNFQKKYSLLERLLAFMRQYEGSLQRSSDVDLFPGATMEMKKLFKKLLDEVLNPGFTPQRGSGGHAILVAMLKAKQQGRLEMPIEQIKDAAEATHLCKHSFYSKGGQAWKAMSELETEKLVVRKTGAIDSNSEAGSILESSSRPPRIRATCSRRVPYLFPVMHKPGLYFTNVAGSQHQLRLTAKGVRAAEKMLFLAGPNQRTVPVENCTPAPIGQNQVAVAPLAPVKKRPKKDDVVKPWEVPRQVNPSTGRKLPAWMNQAKKRPRVTSFDKSGTRAVFERNVVRKLFLDEMQGDGKVQANLEVKKEVKIEKEEGRSSEWPKVAASKNWAPVKMERGNIMVKEEEGVVESKVDSGGFAASNMGQPFLGDVKDVRVKKEAI